MTLQKYTDSLSKEKQFNLAIKLTKLALPIWEHYVGYKKHRYRDSVVGLKHSVNRELLKDSIESAEFFFNSDHQNSELREKLLLLYAQFEDPVIAIQDDDWKLPDNVLNTFYSVYNLLEAMLVIDRSTLDDSAISVSINQAIDALESSKTLTSDEINGILDNFKNF
jgi:hypothetical protein